jgi:alpha-L-fucosidase
MKSVARKLLFIAVAGGAMASFAAYEANWESLNRHEPPEWLQDAKYGIYAHWGLYSVPAYGNEWYAKWLYKNQRPNVVDYHRETYGDPSEFGYKDFIPLFTAEKFDAAEWAKLIKYSGAKYAGLAVVHHDGFMLWDSEVNRWNVGKMGPKRDLYGELVKATRAEDMKVIATFHLLRAFDWMTPPDDKWDQAVEEKWDVVDPEYADFYWSSKHKTHAEFLNEWKLKVREVVDNYQPDALWFDGGSFREEGVEETVMGNLAYYLNKEAEWGKDLEILNKLPTSKIFNFGEDFGMLTFEEGRDRGPTVPRPWVDDMKISTKGWGYLHGQEYKSANEIVDGLVDRVARGGGLLLSLCPLPDGTLNPPQVKVLTEMGDFLTPNGEAIFNTRPWKIHAEGDDAKLNVQGGKHPVWKFHNCDATDIRFTRSKDLKSLYVITLGYPEGGKLLVKSLGENIRISSKGVQSVSSVKTGKPVEWNRSAAGMEIKLPAELGPNEIAYAFKVEVKGSLDMDAPR